MIYSTVFFLTFFLSVFFPVKMEKRCDEFSKIFFSFLAIIFSWILPLKNHFLWEKKGHEKNLTKTIKFQSKAHSTTPFSLQPEVNLMAGSRHEKVGQRFDNVFQFYALEN